MVCGRNHFPFSNVFGKHSLNNFRQLGQNLSIHVRIVYTAIGCSDGDRARVIQRTNSANLHNGHLAIFRHRKLRLGELKCRVVIPDS